MLAEVGIVTEARPLAGLYLPSTNTSTYDRADVAKMSAGAGVARIQPAETVW